MVAKHGGPWDLSHVKSRTGSRSARSAVPYPSVRSWGCALDHTNNPQTVGRRNPQALNLREHTLSGLRRMLRVVYRLLGRSPAAAVLDFPVIERTRRRITATSMSGADVMEIVGLLHAAGISAWLVGGWACDALLAEQTREHDDLDVAIPDGHRELAFKVLEEHGFLVTDVFNAGLMSEAIELLDRRRRRKVGLHFIDIDSNGAGGWDASVRETMQALRLDPRELFATGTVAGHPVPCVSAPALLALHTGYEPREQDRRDVRLICTRFSLPVPPAYERAEHGQ